MFKLGLAEITLFFTTTIIFDCPWLDFFFIFVENAVFCPRAVSRLADAAGVVYAPLAASYCKRIAEIYGNMLECFFNEFSFFYYVLFNLHLFFYYSLCPVCVADKAYFFPEIAECLHITYILPEIVHV